jgi:hypothetical protein
MRALPAVFACGKTNNNSKTIVMQLKPKWNHVKKDASKSARCRQVRDSIQGNPKAAKIVGST